MTVALYAALLTGLYIYLSIRVIQSRREFKVALGDNDHPVMRQRMRAHSNFIEYAPLFLILLLIAELQDLPVIAIHALGVLFLVGRLFHAYGVGYAERIEPKKLVNGHFRARGMILTFTALALTAAIVLIQYAVAQLG